MKHLSLLFFLALVLLTACQAPAGEPTATRDAAASSVESPTEETETTIDVTEEMPTNTPTLMVVQATATEEIPFTPTRTPRPTNTPTPTATATPTLAPSIPPADIEITAPGALSKVISPIPVRALLIPGDQGRVTVELLGEDGRVISRQITILNPNLGRKAGLVIDLAFEIPTEAELGRLVIAVQDEYGRTTALSSTDLVLLSSGQPDFNVVVDRSAPVVIQEPQMNAIIQGDRLVVTGMARPAVSLDFVIELITQAGRVVSQRVFDVKADHPARHVPFIVEVPYSIEEPTWVLLLVREQGNRIPGITYLTSTEVLLSP